VRFWLNRPDEAVEPAEYERRAAVCQTYANAPAARAAGTHTASVDEKTDMQALERAAPILPTRPATPSS
jgi:hypothetical protein